MRWVRVAVGVGGFSGVFGVGVVGFGQVVLLDQPDVADDEGGCGRVGVGGDAEGAARFRLEAVSVSEVSV